MFGSNKGALDASDTLRSATDNAALLSALLVPASVVDKAGLLAWEAAGASLTLNSTGLLKASVSRKRPYVDSSDSFPSAHASTVFNRAIFGVLNTDEYDLHPAARIGIDVGFYTAASATVWARVEAGVHYPSDVLVGAALGNFFARFIYEGLIHEPGTPPAMAGVAILPAADGPYLQIVLPF